MADILTIKDTVARAKAEGLPVSEGALRRWVKEKKVPAVTAGNKYLVYFPNLVRFLTCGSSADGTEDGLRV